MVRFKISGLILILILYFVQGNDEEIKQSLQKWMNQLEIEDQILDLKM